MDGVKNPTPEPPNLYGSSDGGPGIVDSVRVLYHIMHLNTNSGEYGTGVLVNRVDEYASEEAAKAALEAYVSLLTSQLIDPIVDQKGPIFGNESRYVTGRFSQANYYANTGFFRVGRFVGYIRINTREQLSKNANQDHPVGKYISPVAKRLESALLGNLKEAPIPKRVSSALPPQEVYSRVGTLIGPVTITPESWAKVETSGTESETKRILTSGGATKIGYFAIQLASNPKTIIGSVVFPMNSERSAENWFQRTTSEVDDNVSPVGIPSIFNKDSGYYQLIFIKGKSVVILDCYGQDSTSESICDNSLRNLALSWFKSP